jgi:hypothetical protein
VLAGIAQIVTDVYFLLEGKKEYERRKKKRKNLISDLLFSRC